MKAIKVEKEQWGQIAPAELALIEKRAVKSIKAFCSGHTPPIAIDSELAMRWRENYVREAILKKAAKKRHLNEYANMPVDWSRIDYDAFAKSRIRSKGTFTYATVAYLQQKGESHIGDILHGIGLAGYCKEVSEYADRHYYYWLSSVWPRLFKLGIIVRTKRGYYKINEWNR